MFCCLRVDSAVPVTESSRMGQRRIPVELFDTSIGKLSFDSELIIERI